MLQEPSIGETVRDWVVAHGYVDLGLQVVTLALSLLVTLFAVSGALYWLSWLVRLSNAQNVQDFTAKPIPGLRKGKVAGQEFEFGDLVHKEGLAIAATNETVANLDVRVVNAEEAVEKLARAWERFEDVRGKA